jgi:ABC-type Zn2+ transport system substrate-binding protein/surface adhesin
MMMIYHHHNHHHHHHHPENNHPFSTPSRRSVAQALAPKAAELKAKYGKNKNLLNQLTAKLYEDAQVGPLSQVGDLIDEAVKPEKATKRFIDVAPVSTTRQNVASDRI